MAQVNGVNAAKAASRPIEKADAGEVNGRVKVLKESYTFTAELALNDEILGPSLPANAKVVDAHARMSQDAGTGQFSIGAKASTDDSGAALAEDPDAFIDLVDSAGQAADARMGDDAANLEAGYNQAYGSEAQTFALVSTATTTATGGTLSWEIYYVID